MKAEENSRCRPRISRLSRATANKRAMSHRYVSNCDKKPCLERNWTCLVAGSLRGIERKFLVRRGLVVVSYLVRKFFSRSQWTYLFRKSRSWFRDHRVGNTDGFRRQVGQPAVKSRWDWSAKCAREINNTLLNLVSDRRIGINSLAVGFAACETRAYSRKFRR